MTRECEGPGPAETLRLLRGLGRPPEQAAPWLLGKVLVRRRGRTCVSARIVETEAYLGADDPAAHSFRGRTPRTAPLFGPPGSVYVYFIYGMHHCLNIAVDRDGVPGCVLIRAVEMRSPQGGAAAPGGSGPGRLCAALRLDTRLSGRYLFAANAPLTLRDGPPPRCIGVSSRVGIRRAADRPLRFFDEDSPAVTRRSILRGRLSARPR